MIKPYKQRVASSILQCSSVDDETSVGGSHFAYSHPHFSTHMDWPDVWNIFKLLSILFIYLSADLSVLISDFLRQRSRSKIWTAIKGFIQRGKPFPLTHSTYTPAYSPSCTSETQKQYLKLKSRIIKNIGSIWQSLSTSRQNYTKLAYSLGTYHAFIGYNISVHWVHYNCRGTRLLRSQCRIHWFKFLVHWFSGFSHKIKNIS